MARLTGVFVLLLLALGAPQRVLSAELAVTVVSTRLTLDEVEVDADWYVPAVEPVALLTLQHGYTRECANLRETSRQLAQRGLLVLCLNAQMSGGNPLLADALATLLNSGASAPGGRPLPQQIIVGGHSAGAVFAARVGWRLTRLAPDRLLGALLFDPVASGDFAAHLLAISETGKRPVLAITANPGGCNAQGNVLPVLRQVRSAALNAGRDGFVGLRLSDRSTHVDAEGADTTAFAVRVCGQGEPQPANIDALRLLAGQWALDMAHGERSGKGYPRGEQIELLRGAGAAAPIE